MKKLCFLVWILYHGIVCFAAERGFIFTAPKVLDAGSKEIVTLTLFNVPNTDDITLKLLRAHDNEILMQTKLRARKNYITSKHIEVPDVKDTHAKLQIESPLDFKTGYRINATKEVRIRHNSIVIFIQTDKPIYKPGETVKFRILPLDTWLLPLKENPIGIVWIEDPNGIRITQWRHVDFSAGMVQLELPLSEEPILGNWKISARLKNTTNVQDFKIDEYVLPKFEVQIVPPSYIMADAKKIDIKICAQYTYGKKVEGYLKAKVSYQLHDYEKQNHLPFVDYESMISGCTEFSVASKDILLHRRFPYRKLQISAEVIENSTEIKQNSSVMVDITETLFNIHFLGAEAQESHYFKPGLPYYGTIKITKPDGSVANSEHIEVCAKPKKKNRESDTELCGVFISDTEGRVNFVVPPQSTSVYSIQLDAKSLHKEKYYKQDGGRRISRPHSTIYLTPWYSPSNNHLQIEPITETIDCGKYDHHIKIRYTTTVGSEIKFYHQVISRGNIIQHGFTFRSFSAKDKVAFDFEDELVLRPKNRKPYASIVRGVEGPDDDTNDVPSFNNTLDVAEFILSFTLNGRANMSPLSRLIVYYIREDGEVVADTTSFGISSCFKNKVKLHFRHSQQLPSTEASLFLSAAPNSLCGVGLTDKSVHLLAKEKQFNKDKVFELIKAFNLGKDTAPQQRTSFCKSDDSDLAFPSFPPSWHPPPTYDGYPYRRRRMTMMYNRRLKNEYVDTIMAFDEAGMVIMTDFKLENRPCPYFGHRWDYLQEIPPTPCFGPSCRKYPMLASRTSIGKPEAARFLVLPPGINKEKSVEKPQPNPELEIRNYFPETWLWEMHNVSSSGEMVIKRELPHTITQWKGKAVCVNFNEGLGISDEVNVTVFQPFFISFTLPYSVIRGEVISARVTVFNYLSECLPIKLSLHLSESFKIVNQHHTHKLCICGKESESWIFQIRPIDLGAINITVFAYSLLEDPVCENVIATAQTARDAVTHKLIVEAEGFPKEETINLHFCPEKSNGTFYKEIELLLPDNNVANSARCYLSVTGDLMGQALNGLERLVRLPVGCGEQNMVLFTPNIYILSYLTATKRVTDELKYKILSHLKTGYQRELKYKHDDGSYSAFGKSDDVGSMWLTAFVVKSFYQARRYTPIDEGDLAVSTSWIVLKQLENGCFPATGYLFNKALKGGLNSDSSSLAPLTAYVLISLLETNFRDKTTVDSALVCLRSEKYPSTYSLALFAYAAALAKSPDANSYLEILEARAIKTEHLQYWDYNGKDSKAINVEIAGYVILALLELGGTDNLAKCMPIVRWIVQQRNSHGGFISTQDTVVALQALATYGSLSISEKVDMKVTIDTDELEHTIKVDESNKFLMQSVKLPIVPAVVDFQAIGQGCALAQFHLKYNVDAVSEVQVLDLKITATRSDQHDCDKPVIKICMRYNVPGQITNMVIIEAKMVSGYAPDEFELHMLHNDKSLNLKRHDVKENNVVFYFSKLTNEERCFEFPVKSEIDVYEYMPATVKMYDYYQPELQIEASYEIPVNCSKYKNELSPLSFDDFMLSTVIGETSEQRRSPSTDEQDTSPNTDEQNISLHTQAPEKMRTSAENTNSDHTNSAYNFQNDAKLESNNSTEITLSLVNTTDYSPTVEMAGELLVTQQQSGSESLKNFVNVDEDLDFPSGEEANKPVYVLPPQNMDP